MPINEAFFQNNSPPKDQLDELNNLPLSNAFEDAHHLNIGGHLFLNYSHPFIRNQLMRTIRFWLNEGVDGFYLTRLHEIQFNQENPEHLIELLNSLKHQLNLYTKQSTIDLDLNLIDEDQNFLELNPDKPARVLIASKESLDFLHKRLKRTLIDFWTQETKINDAKLRNNLYPITINNRALHNNTILNELNYQNQLNLSQSINFPFNLDSSSNKARNAAKMTFNQFINHYFQTRNKHLHHHNKKLSKASAYFNVYSYFDLVDTFLDLKLNGSEQIRDQINEVYLANNLDEELFKDSTTVHSNTIVLWSIGDHTRQRLANRLHLNSVLVAQFILSMLPGSISLFYGDEIGLCNIQNVNTVKVSLLG